MGFAASHQDPAAGDVLKAVVGVGGLAMCITLVFRGMRAVMDIGGECADGATYVAAPSCPEGVPIALVGGIFGGFLFGAIAMAYGSRLGGIWRAIPLLAWTALFATLGWNFLDYGLLSPPPEADGIVWGWLIPGVVFELMAWAPLVFLVVGWRATRRAGLEVDLGLAGIGASMTMPGPGQPVRDTTDTPWAHATVGMVEGVPEPVGGPAPGGAPEEGTEFSEGSQALLDRLERLGDMRDRGLLTVEEFETAKGPIVAELESRS